MEDTPAALTPTQQLDHQAGQLQDSAHRLVSLANDIRDVLFGEPPASSASEAQPARVGWLGNQQDALGVVESLLNDVESTLQQIRGAFPSQ